MSQIQFQWHEISNIETEMVRYLVALGIDWHDELAMTQLATECKHYGPEQAQAAYLSHDQTLINKAKLYALVTMMMRTMESAAGDDRDVHAGEVWKAFARHLYT
jgi:hypothetical protein